MNLLTEKTQHSHHDQQKSMKAKLLCNKQQLFVLLYVLNWTNFDPQTPDFTCQVITSNKNVPITIYLM